jgi:uncharacterized membrane protein YqgA involved in biofilm formation
VSTQLKLTNISYHIPLATCFGYKTHLQADYYLYEIKSCLDFVYTVLFASILKHNGDVLLKKMANFPLPVLTNVVTTFTYCTELSISHVSVDV